MTFLVHTLCFNHKEHVATLGISFGTEELKKRKLCQSSFHFIIHKMFGFSNPLIFAFLCPKNDIKKATITVFEFAKELEKDQFDKEEKINYEEIDKFLKAYDDVISVGLDPERVFYIPGKKLPKRTDKFRLERPETEKLLSFEYLLESITIKKEPYFDEGKILLQKDNVKPRTQACIDFQHLSRDHEKEFLNKIIEFQASPLLEQRWIILVALRYYILGELSNEKVFYEILLNGLKDEYFFIRAETRELALIYSLLNGEIRRMLIERLINERDINLKLTGIALAIDSFRDLKNLSNNEYPEDYYIDIPQELFERELDLEEFEKLFELVIPHIVKLVDETLPDVGTYWKKFGWDNFKETNITPLKEKYPDISKLESLEYNYFYPLGRILHHIRTPFQDIFKK